MTPAEPEKKPQAAVTTAEAAATKNPYLTLSTLKLSVLPNGLDKLRCLTNLDISNNPITSIPEDALPHSLVELIITGCVAQPVLCKGYAARRAPATPAAVRGPRRGRPEVGQCL